ncbi:MAG: Nif3-like dinuclear metal center hexameric protein [Verrucomicrobia bacterium]|nr:Nif3-like dinuclear metal center hexameric protein [Verrucomicrobiota bacterium]
MNSTKLEVVVNCCNRWLHPERVRDWDGAVNGLQVENPGTVTRIAAAVDASPATVRLAIRAHADLLLVHHGLFWSPRQPWTGPNYTLLRLLLDHRLAVYSAHLPLDIHPRLGNNARLAAALGFRTTTPFFFDRGTHLGLQARTRIPRETLTARLHRATGNAPRVVPGGPAICRRIGIVTGGAGAELARAAAEGADTFVTGEGPHWTYALAEELGVNVLYGGHYATETFGVKALARRLAARFKLPWVFLEHPTGL